MHTKPSFTLRWQALANHLGESITTTRLLCMLVLLLALGSALLLAGPLLPLLGDEFHAGSAGVVRGLIGLTLTLSGSALMAAAAVLGVFDRLLAPGRLRPSATSA